jgi:hypothetical protein
MHLVCERLCSRDELSRSARKLRPSFCKFVKGIVEVFMKGMPLEWSGDMVFWLIGANTHIMKIHFKCILKKKLNKKFLVCI